MFKPKRQRLSTPMHSYIAESTSTKRQRFSTTQSCATETRNVTESCGVVTNPNVTKKYSIPDLLDILCGFKPIPEEDMFVEGPLKERYYEEQSLKNTRSNSIYQNLPNNKKKTSSKHNSTSTTRRQLFPDFDEISNFSICMASTPDEQCADDIGSYPLGDISNVENNNNWRPRTPRKARQVFFKDTQVEDEDANDEIPILLVPKKTYFKDVDDIISSQLNNSSRPSSPLF